MTNRIRIADVLIVDRHRAELGDLDGLAKSITELGLLHPIVITPDDRLVAGHRRLAAAEALGWLEIEATVVTNLNSAMSLLHAERDENEQRKEMTPSEKVSLGRALEELERPKALERKAEAGRSAAPGRPAETSVRANGSLPESRNEVRDIVGPAVGLSPAGYGRARSLVKAAETGDKVAAEAVKEMDATGKITPAYEKWRGGSTAGGRAKPMTPLLPAPKLGTRRKHVEMLEKMAATLSGLLVVMDEITELDASVGNQEAARFGGDLSKALTGLRRVNNLLKERTSWASPSPTNNFESETSSSIPVSSDLSTSAR